MIGGPTYKGPTDGRSRTPSRWVRPAVELLTRSIARVSLEGEENVPGSGGNLICPNHPATSLDVYLPHIFSKGDLRTMVRIRRFESQAMADFSVATGAYPVDRSKASSITKQHTLDILKGGGDVLLFPEGRYSEETGEVSPLKRGAASFAYKAAKTITPVGFHFEEDREPRFGQTLLAAAGAAALGLAAGSVGGPVAGAVAGVAAGTKLARRLARAVVSRVQPDRKLNERLHQDPAILAGASVVGGLVGGALGALAGTLCTVPASLAVGLGAFSLARDYIHRPNVKVSIGEPIDVEPYRELDKRSANTALTEELHRRIGSEVEKLSGVPYDESAPKIFQEVGNPEKRS